MMKVLVLFMMKDFPVPHAAYIPRTHGVCSPFGPVSSRANALA